MQDGSAVTTATPNPKAAEKEVNETNRYICAVCLDYLQVPKLLPCGHTFCQKCLYSLLENLAGKNALPFTCPVCRKPNVGLVYPEDAVKLPSNIYITPMDIARSRLASRVECPSHRGSLLKYLCTECDCFVCGACKVESHLKHHVKDLTFSESQQQKVVQKAVTPEAKVQQEADVKDIRTNLKATITRFRSEQRMVKRRRGLLEREVKFRTKLVTGMLEEASETALRKLNQLGETEENKLQASIDHMQRLLTDLAKKDVTPNTIQEAGKAVKKRLTTRKQLTLKTNVHVGIHTLKTMVHFVGLPSAFTVDKLEPLVSLKRLFRVGEDEEEVNLGYSEYRVIHTLCAVDEEEMISVLYSRCTMAGKAVCYQTGYTNKGRVISKVQRNTVDAITCVNGQLVRHHTQCSHARGYSRFLVFRDTKHVIYRVYEYTPGAATGYKLIMNKLGLQPDSFDASPDGQFFAMVTKLDGFTDKLPEGLLPRPKDVVLYQSQDVYPIAVYKPPFGQPYSPSDVCFFLLHGTCVLLVADWTNDLVHVLHVGDAGMTFVRYLGTGSNDLIKPRILVPDSRGRLLIGCGDGQVVMCTPI